MEAIEACMAILQGTDGLAAEYFPCVHTLKIVLSESKSEFSKCYLEYLNIMETNHLDKSPLHNFDNHYVKTHPARVWTSYGELMKVSAVAHPKYRQLKFIQAR